tara:strand:- start:35288 stop:35509 length:222 start_codon:yes stop_codon:yes gene_type:complete
MNKFKDYVLAQEDLFYTRADAIVKSSEFEAEAVNRVVVLAQDMNLLSYLGGYTAVEDMVCDAWYDNNFEHIAV